MQKWSHEDIEKLMEGITPGKWDACIADNGGFNIEIYKGGFIIDKGGFIIASRNGYPDWPVKEESQANAQFIAAAPDIIRQLLAEIAEKEKEMSTCRKCGCTTPCRCTQYSDRESLCANCGCTQPCACTHYTD
jgi:hypothetical protein